MRKQRQEDASEEKVGELTISYFRSEVYPFHLKHVPTLEAGVAFAGKTCQRSPFFHCTYDQSVFPLVQRLILSAYDDEASIDFRVFEANRGGKLLESPIQIRTAHWRQTARARLLTGLPSAGVGNP